MAAGAHAPRPRRLADWSPRDDAETRTIIDAAGTRAKLDDVVATVRCEGEGAEADPFGEAMVAGAMGPPRP